MWWCLVLACAAPMPDDDTGTSPDDTDTGTTPDDTDTGTTPDDSDTGASLDVGLGHRPTAEACPEERPSAEEPLCGYDELDACTVNADCTEGANGRCRAMIGVGVCECQYDACVTDADCHAGTACGCAAETWSGTNECVRAECRVDAECATGLCMADRATCGETQDAEALWLDGYRCATPEDTCRSDDVCGEAGDFCAFALRDGYWSCNRSYAWDCE